MAERHNARVNVEWLDQLPTFRNGHPPAVEEALLVDYPVAAGLRRQEYRHGLLREFQLITFGVHEHCDELTVPRRLLALADEMTSCYGQLIEQHTAQLEDAMAAGDRTVVLRYPLAPAAVELEVELAWAMEESDAYCRDEALITIEPTEEAYLLRRWVVEEVARQYHGSPPRSWPEFLADVGRKPAEPRNGVVT